MPALHRLLLLLLPLLWAGSLQQEPRYTLHVQQSVTVQQGLCVLVPCSFSYPVSFWPPPRQTYMSWFQITYYLYDGEPVATSNPKHMLQPKIKGRFHLLGDVRTRNCSLHIRGARMEDAGYYVFRIETSKNNHVYADNAVNLRVTALTEKPVLLVPEALQSGRATTLSCVLPGSCPGGPPLTFSWSGSALHSVDPGSLSSSELTLTPRPRDHNSSLTCQVKVGGAGVNLERTIRLNVSYAPQDLTISVFFRNGTALKIVSNGSSLSLPEEQSLRLVCEADSNPPAKLSWNWKGKEGPGPSQVSGSGVLELAHARAEDGGAFTCQAQHVLGSRHLLLTLSVQRSLRTCICEAERQEGSWPLALTLIRGALMGTGFLLTYGLTRIYYTRCAGGAPGHSSEKPHRAP